MHHSRRNWRTFLGFAVLAVALMNVDTSAAQAQGGPRGPKGPHGGGRPLPGMTAPGQPPGPGGRGKHERGEAGAPRFDRGHEPGQTPEAMKVRLQELKQKGTQGTLTADEQQELRRLQRHSGPRQTREQRKARIAELQQKQASGALTAEEQSELDKARKIQARRDALGKQDTARDQTRKARGRDAKRQALTQYPNLGHDAAAVAEFQKHAERLAKLERAKEVATADGRTDVATKVDELITKENQRHQTWVARHPANPQPATQGAAQ